MAQTQLLYRSSKALDVLNTHPSYERVENFQKPTIATRTAVYSPDGEFFAYSTIENVKIFKSSNGELVCTLEDVKGALELAFSPKASYIAVWVRPFKREDGNAGENLTVWKTLTGERISGYVQKSQTASGNLQFTYDEKYVARMGNNEIQFFESSNMKKIWQRLKVENITDFSVSNGKSYSIAVFSAEKKGSPGWVRIYQIPNFQLPISQKSFFKAESVQLKWNKLGTSVIALTSTDVDNSGKSYYGETNLYLLGIFNSFSMHLVLDKEGPIYDVEWSPNSKEFGVVYGYIPSKTIFIDARGNTVKEIPPSHKNTILFSPHGRFVLVAGFGNLQGSVDVYDVENSFKKITTFEAPNSTLCEWCPDGQYIMTATTSPRLRVDNGIKIWHYTGKLMYNFDIDELYNVRWKPQNVDLFPLKHGELPSAPLPHESAKDKAMKAESTKPAGAYRPPGARGTTHSRTIVREEYSSTAGKKLPSRNRLPPGAVPKEELSKSAIKNKKKRESKKRENGFNNPKWSSDDPNNKDFKRDGKEKDKDNKEKDNGENGTINNLRRNSKLGASTEAKISFEEKKARSLHKKLRAIEELKYRLANGEPLEETQKKKIANEEEIKSELRILGWDLNGEK